MVSEDVFRQLRQRPEVYCTEVGSRVVKGIDEPIRVYRLEPGASLARELLSAAKARPARTNTPKRYAKPISVGLAVCIMTFMTLGAWMGIGGGPELGSYGADGDIADTDETILYSYDSTNLQIKRQANGTTQVLTENIESLSLAYFDSAGNATTTSANIRQVQVQITARTAKPDPGYNTNGGYRTYTLTSFDHPKK